HALEPHRLDEATVVLGQAQPVELAFVGVPVGLDALEDAADGGPTELGDVHVGLGPGHDLAVEPEILRSGGSADVHGQVDTSRVGYMLAERLARLGPAL